MRIVEIRERSFAAGSRIRNAAFDLSGMTTSVVGVVTDLRRGGRPVVGLAFTSTGRHACGGPMRARFIPRLLEAPPGSLLGADGLVDPELALAAMLRGEKPGGHSERSIPIGTIETAIWDAVAKAADVPLWHLLAQRYRGGLAASHVFCYVGGGWYRPGGSLSALQDEIRGYQGAGYTQVKIKVGGLPVDEDIARIEAALSVLGDARGLAVDANAALDREAATALASRLAPYGLRWFEEPVDPLDLAGHAALARAYDPPLATGENLFSLQDVENLLAFGGFRLGHDVLQVDPPQAYGLSTYARIADRIGEGRDGIFPHGGNLMSFAAVAGLGLGGCESYPEVFGAFGGYADDMVVENGRIALPDRPGIGFEGHPAFAAVAAELIGDLT
jgi:L-alanine-DL-glutamate epimerase-like enolase superfamily enzyme